jgi:HK97 family phage prohead protease
MRLRQQTFRIETKVIDKERRVVPSRLSDPGTDRMAEEIAATAWKTLPADFPILWQHDQRQPAIARGRNAQARSDGLYADLHFPPAGTYAQADLVFDLVTLGILTDISVGFLSHQQEVTPDGRLRHVECELLEASVVNIGANPRAQVLARALGFTGDLGDAVSRPRVFARGSTVLSIIDDTVPPGPWRSWEPSADPVVRILDDTEPLVRMPTREQFARAWEQAVTDIVSETYNRLRGRVD